MSNRRANPPPPRDRNGFGEARTDALRVRPVLFGFACVVEEQIECRDGTTYWQRLRWPELIRKPDDYK